MEGVCIRESDRVRVGSIPNRPKEVHLLGGNHAGENHRTSIRGGRLVPHAQVTMTKTMGFMVSNTNTMRGMVVVVCEKCKD